MVVAAISGWALKTTLDHASRIKGLESHSIDHDEATDRRFEEMAKALEEIKRLLLELLKGKK